MRAVLLEDVISVFKGRVYGRAGDEVTILSQRGDVLIVQASSGDRYPVHQTKISNANEKATTKNQDHRDEQPLLGRDSSTRKKGSAKAKTNPEITSKDQITLW